MRATSGQAGQEGAAASVMCEDRAAVGGAVKRDDEDRALLGLLLTPLKIRRFLTLVVRRKLTLLIAGN
jgi:hypothetical protein